MNQKKVPRGVVSKLGRATSCQPAAFGFSAALFLVFGLEEGVYTQRLKTGETCYETESRGTKKLTESDRIGNWQRHTRSQTSEGGRGQHEATFLSTCLSQRNKTEVIERTKPT
jgi:hypothetical protein